MVSGDNGLPGANVPRNVDTEKIYVHEFVTVPFRHRMEVVRVQGEMQKRKIAILDHVMVSVNVYYFRG